MSVKYSNEQAVKAAKTILDKEVDEKDKEAAKDYRSRILSVANNIRTALADRKIEDAAEELNELLRTLDKEAMRLQFGVRFDAKTEHPPLLGEEIDEEVMETVAEACAVLGLNAPIGYTGRMFQRWGFMMGMIRQVNEVKKIGTGGFEALAEMNHLQCSAEYIVYHKAQEYGEEVTKHLGKGCMERIEEVLKQHKAI